MLEIEQKYSGVDFASLEQQLHAWGADRFELHEEEDQYLAAPDRDFKMTGEAFRLRRAGKDAFLTYKGPRLQTEAKIRAELDRTSRLNPNCCSPTKKAGLCAISGC